MSPRILKRRLQKDLRAKQNKQRPYRLLLFLLLLGLSGLGTLHFWIKQRPAALLRQGLRFEQQTQLDQALANYREIYLGYKQSPEADDALYRSGLILQHENGKDREALLLYLQLENDYPQSRLMVAAQQQAAEITKYRLNDCRQAIPVYQRLSERQAAVNPQSLYEIADCYTRMKNWPQAVIEFEALLKRPLDGNLAPLTTYRLADSWLLSGEKEKAVQVFKQLIADYPDHELSQEAAFHLAEMLEEAEHLKAALKAFTQLNAYPRQDLLQQRILRLKKRIVRKKKVL